MMYMSVFLMMVVLENDGNPGVSSGLSWFSMAFLIIP